MKSLRWRIAGIICLGMTVNYLDRQVLSMLAPEIRDAFRLTNNDYARIVFAFQLAYMFGPRRLFPRLTANHLGGHGTRVGFWVLGGCQIADVQQVQLPAAVVRGIDDHFLTVRAEPGMGIAPPLACIFSWGVKVAERATDLGHGVVKIDVL